MILVNNDKYSNNIGPVLLLVEPLAYWLRWGRVPCEENDGCAWLPLGCIVALEWLVDTKHGVMAWVLYCTCL